MWRMAIRLDNANLEERIYFYDIWLKFQILFFKFVVLFANSTDCCTSSKYDYIESYYLTN